MQQPLPFGEILDAAETLPPDDQEALVEIMHRRLVERGRKRIVAEVHEARGEFAEGQGRVCTVEELMNEILS